MDLDFEFKKKFTLEERQGESARIMDKYPDRTPIVVETTKTSNFKLDKNKYLVPSDLTFGQLIHVIRRRVHLKPEEAVYLFTAKGTLETISALVSSVYNEYKDEDGFVYFMVSKEETFG